MPEPPKKAAGKKAAPSPSSSAETEASGQHLAILELGRQIVAEFGEGSEHNVTSRWIAHHLAGVMAAARTDPARAEECRNLILQLWRERRFFPSGDPLERYSKILSALEAHLGVHPGFVHLRHFAGKQTPLKQQDWGELTQTLRRRADRLLSLTVLLAAKSEKINDDDLIGIANTANPDDQSRLLSQLQIVLSFDDADDTSAEASDPVIEALDSLQECLTDYRAKYVAHEKEGTGS